MLITRPPRDLTDAVRAEAERLDLSYSDYVANCLAATHGFPPVVTSKDTSKMKLTA